MQKDDFSGESSAPVDGDPEPEIRDVESTEIEWLDAPSELSSDQKAAACANVERVPSADWDCGPCPLGEDYGCKDVQFFVHYENTPCEACADGNLCLSVIEAKCAYHQRCRVDEQGEPFCEVPDDPYEDGDCDTQGFPCDIDSITTQGVFCDEYNGVMFFDRSSHGGFFVQLGGLRLLRNSRQLLLQ